MTRRVIRTVIALATLSIAGIVLIQIFWMQKAFDLKEREFSDRVNIALRSVAKEIMIMSNDSSDVCAEWRATFCSTPFRTFPKVASTTCRDG